MLSGCRILVLYEAKSCCVSTIKEHLNSFAAYSKHSIHYAPATRDYPFAIDLTAFDAVVIHYSVRVSVTEGNFTISPTLADQLTAYQGLKVLFIQDEYDTTNIAKAWAEQLGIHTIYTCVPAEFVRSVYAESYFDAVEFVCNLTGYVPEKLLNFPVLPLRDRPLDIAYRGRNLPFWYGDLGQEKEWIGKKMREYAIQYQLKQDIEWQEEKRIYGDGWYQFLASARTTLGTESGSCLFDFTGEISRTVRAYLLEHPKASYETVHERFLSEHDGQIKMNQISPKIFEAICLKTALVLFEGDYSHVVKPHEHFIVLQKDFSNIQEVMDKIADQAYLEQLTERAYRDIIESGEYSYQQFIRRFDDWVSDKLSSGKYQLSVDSDSANPSAVVPGRQPLPAVELNKLIPPPPKKRLEPIIERLLASNSLRAVYAFIYRTFGFARPLLVSMQQQIRKWM